MFQPTWYWSLFRFWHYRDFRIRLLLLSVTVKQRILRCFCRHSDVTACSTDRQGFQERPTDRALQIQYKNGPKIERKITTLTYVWMWHDVREFYRPVRQVLHSDVANHWSRSSINNRYPDRAQIASEKAAKKKKVAALASSSGPPRHIPMEHVSHVHVVVRWLANH